MNFVKRPLGILLALAIVFTTIVCVSVGASVDFPIHNSVVSYSEGYTQNCKQAKPEYAGNNKIAYFSVQDVGSTNALAKAMAANLKTFVNNSEITGDYISIDFYAEFTTSADNARVAASLDFGAGKVLPQPKNTNVAKPTENQSFDFVNGKMVTMKLLKEEVLTSVIADEDSLDSVAITLFPQRNETVTGTFFFSVPYFAVDDGDNVSTVNLTSIKTTTTKADEQYTGQITVYPDGATFVGKHADAKVSVPGTGTNRATAFYGDIAGYEKKYLHFDGDGQQLQIIETQISGLAELRERAIATDKLICIDIYANEFTNGGVKNAMCDLQLLFNGGKQIGTDNDRKTIRSNIKQTVSFLPTMVGASSTKLNITLQNYSYGDQKNITNGKFIITAPYVEGDKPSEVFEPVTTTTTTTFVPPVQAYDGSVAIYDNGVTYSAKDSWNGTNKMFLGDFTSENFDATNKYVHIDSIGTPQQIQGKLNLQNMSSIVNKATKEKKTVFIDIYANNFKNGGHSGKADFIVTFSGGSATGDRDCTIAAGKRNTLAIAPSKVGNGGYFAFTIQNYSYGDYKTIIDAKFILSVPYTVDDIEGATLVTPSTTTTTTQSTTTTTLGQPDYGTIKTDADGNPVTDENGNPVYEKLPLKIKDTPVVYDANGSWGNPDGAFYLSSDKKSANVFSANPYQNFQFYVQAKNLPQLIVDAAAKNANVAVDFYGNFLEKGKTKENSQAKAKVSFGKNIFYGANPNNADGGDQWKMKYFKTDTVMRFEINARDYLNRLKAQGTTTKKDTSRKESEQVLLLIHNIHRLILVQLMLS